MAAAVPQTPIKRQTQTEEGRGKILLRQEEKRYQRAIPVTNYSSARLLPPPPPRGWQRLFPTQLFDLSSRPL